MSRATLLQLFTVIIILTDVYMLFDQSMAVIAFYMDNQIDLYCYNIMIQTSGHKYQSHDSCHFHV